MTLRVDSEDDDDDDDSVGGVGTGAGDGGRTGGSGAGGGGSVHLSSVGRISLLNATRARYVLKKLVAFDFDENLSDIFVLSVIWYLIFADRFWQIVQLTTSLNRILIRRKPYKKFLTLNN